MERAVSEKAEQQGLGRRSVCFVAPNAYPVLANADFGKCGGAEVQQVLLGRALVNEGCRVAFVVGDYGQEAREELEGIEVWRGPFGYLGGGNWRYPMDTLRLMGLLRRVGADVNVLKCPRNLLLGMGLHRRLLGGGRLVKIVAHDSDCGRQSLRFLPYTLGAKLVDCTVFQSRDQEVLGGASLGLAGPVIRNIAHPWEERGAERSRDIDVLWVGTSVARKQPGVLLDLAEAMEDVHFTMIMAPGQDAPLRLQVEARAGRLANVDYLGFVEYKEIGAYYQRAKLVALTSAAEGFPNVFLQAWQAKTAVVSLRVDPDGLIGRYAMGRVSGSVEQMRRDVEGLLGDADLRASLGHNGARYVAEEHGSKRIVQSYLELFAGLCGNGDGGKASR